MIRRTEDLSLRDQQPYGTENHSSALSLSILVIDPLPSSIRAGYLN
jgi:hypothetical protein